MNVFFSSGVFIFIIILSVAVCVRLRKKIALSKINFRNSTKEITRRFQDVAESSGEWIWQVDACGRYVYSNSVVEKILGYGTQEVIGKYFYDYLIPENKEEIRRAAFEAFSKKESFINKKIRKDGKVIILETNGTPFRDVKGNLTGYIGIDRDITERKRAEEELMRILSLHDATLEATADGILVVDLNGRVVSYNKKFLQLWKIPESLAAAREDGKLLEYALGQLVNPEEFIGEVRMLCANPEAQSSNTLRFKDGRIFDRFSQTEKIGDKIVGCV